MAKLKSSGHRVGVTTHAVTRLYHRLEKLGNVATSRTDLQRLLSDLTAKALAKGDYQEVIDDGVPTRVVAMTIHGEKLYALVRDDRYDVQRRVVVTVLDPAMHANNLATKWKVPMNSPFEQLRGMEVSATKVEEEKPAAPPAKSKPDPALHNKYLVEIDGDYAVYADLESAMAALASAYGRSVSLWKNVQVSFDIQVKVDA